MHFFVAIWILYFVFILKSVLENLYFGSNYSWKESVFLKSIYLDFLSRLLCLSDCLFRYILEFDIWLPDLSVFYTHKVLEELDAFTDALHSILSFFTISTARETDMCHSIF